jgi:hypothetical protein
LLNVHTYLAHLDEKGEVSFEELWSCRGLNC